VINRLVDQPSLKSKQNGGSAQDPSALLSSALENFDVQSMLRPVEELIVKHSGLALVAAFAVGVTIACLVKRR